MRFRVLAVPLMLALLAATASQAAAEEFTFHNQSSFVDETKIMHVYGEIKNESGAAVKDILITASFYDKDGNLLNEYQRQPELRVIGPGESAPFEALYLDQKTVDRVANFTLSATGQPADVKPKQLKIITSSSRLDVLGTYYINVIARNEGDVTATNTMVIATLYDKDGKVVSIGRALAEPGYGSTSLASGQEAGFGIVVTEKLQTYKAVRYSLVADSDQYVSDVVTLQAAGLGVGSTTNLNGNGQQSGCLIATAAFGSELAPQVQKLRTFRDGIALQTFAGSSFMNVFNSWYYSFSPAVADYEREASWLKGLVRTSVYPLLGILDMSTAVYDLLSFNKEAAIMGAGLTASSLIGAIYFAPLSAALVLVSRKKRLKAGKIKYILAAAWLASLVLVLCGEILASSELMMAGTSLLVLSAISTVVLAITRAIKW